MPYFSLISTAEQEHVVCTGQGVLLLTCVFYGFNLVVQLNFFSLHHFSLIKNMILRYTAVPYSGETVFIFLIIQALHERLPDMNWKTDAYNY